MKSPLKRVLYNRKLKKGLCYPFFTVFVKIFAGEKIANFSQSSLWDHIVLISQTDDISMFPISPFPNTLTLDPSCARWPKITYKHFTLEHKELHTQSLP